MINTEIVIDRERYGTFMFLIGRIRKIDRERVRVKHLIINSNHRNRIG